MLNRVIFADCNQNILPDVLVVMVHSEKKVVDVGWVEVRGCSREMAQRLFQLIPSALNALCVHCWVEGVNEIDSVVDLKINSEY